MEQCVVWKTQEELAEQVICNSRGKHQPLSKTLRQAPQVLTAVAMKPLQTQTAAVAIHDLSFSNHITNSTGVGGNG
jgi:hypothetical protein